MGEKGNVADAAAAIAAAPLADGSGVVGAVVSGVGDAAGAGVTVVSDVADATRSKLTEIAADHLIDEGRTRLRGGGETTSAADSGGSADQGKDDRPDGGPQS